PRRVRHHGRDGAGDRLRGLRRVACRRDGGDPRRAPAVALSRGDPPRLLRAAAGDRHTHRYRRYPHRHRLAQRPADRLRSRLGQPAGSEMRLAIQEFGKARPYWRAMLRPVEAIVLIYVLVTLLFACVFAGAYRLDPGGAFSRGAADADVTFLEFIYFSAVTMG